VGRRCGDGARGLDMPSLKGVESATLVPAGQNQPGWKLGLEDEIFRRRILAVRCERQTRAAEYGIRGRGCIVFNLSQRIGPAKDRVPNMQEPEFSPGSTACRPTTATGFVASDLRSGRVVACHTASAACGPQAHNMRRAGGNVVQAPF
jgi:hypothetical protein